MQLQLTNESVKKRFTSPFHLVIHTIDVAKDLMKTGRCCKVHTSIQNPAFQALLEVEEEKEILPTAVSE